MLDAQLKKEFLLLRRAALKKFFSKMNDMQTEAVFKTKGPVLILAGAGSGKTTVVVNRIANIIMFGDAYESAFVSDDKTQSDIDFLQSYVDGKTEDIQQLRSVASVYPPKPWNVLAITFTNKAAGELKNRLNDMLSEEGNDIWASTFHSACVRILRKNIDKIGYKNNFTIYDSDDSIRLIKEGFRSNGINDKNFSPRAVLSAIGSAKDSFLSPKEYLEECGGDYSKQVIAKVYDYYQSQLKLANALDFDDIILLTVKLLQDCPDVLSYYQNKFKYIMVDEYQDTNNAQYNFVSLLAQGHQNICVVGDDDQSIYKFRGATIENILNFEKMFKDATVVRLEQNYRCTQTILDAANSVIEKNIQRKGKTLWTDNGQGDKIKVYRGQDEQHESKFIAETITENVANGKKYNDHAILYRMNAQSNLIEQAMIKSGIPYKIVGGLKFFDRKEVKDIIAYLSVINNTSDTIRLKRIINEPKRGIGDTTVNKIDEIAQTVGTSFYDVISNADQYQPLSKKSNVLSEFTKTLGEISESFETLEPTEAFDILLEKSGYKTFLDSLGREGQQRLENINELKSNIIKYYENSDEPSLGGFLEEVALYTDIDSLNDDADYVVMMTMHSAKGLEFPNVFFCGAEEGIFPGIQAMYNEELVEEERRLAYVCITRAKENLYISNAHQRMLFGKTTRNKPSRFLEEIPKDFLDITDDGVIVRKPINYKANLEEIQQRNRSLNNISVGDAEEQSVLFVVGDTIKHKVFGKGIVIGITPMGNDHLIEVAFDKVGTKKLMQNFAKLKKVQ
ncbi:MAG: 3'-5' exonuclease [Oscillospiraceae bacterium]